MNAVSAGTGIALCVAGWPLYSLVSSGSMDATSALVRGGIVAAGCAFGVSLLLDLAAGYEREAQRTRRRKLTSLFNSMEGAVANGALVDPEADPTKATGTPAPSPDQGRTRG
jgi:hypothetical protein